jgi:hypothetical protein
MDCMCDGCCDEIIECKNKGDRKKLICCRPTREKNPQNCSGCTFCTDKEVIIGDDGK